MPASALSSGCLANTVRALRGSAFIQSKRLKRKRTQKQRHTSCVPRRKRQNWDSREPGRDAQRWQAGARARRRLRLRARRPGARRGGATAAGPAPGPARPAPPPAARALAGQHGGGGGRPSAGSAAAASAAGARGVVGQRARGGARLPAEAHPQGVHVGPDPSEGEPAARRPGARPSRRGSPPRPGALPERPPRPGRPGVPRAPPLGPRAARRGNGPAWRPSAPSLAGRGPEGAGGRRAAGQAPPRARSEPRRRCGPQETEAWGGGALALRGRGAPGCAPQARTLWALGRLCPLGVLHSFLWCPQKSPRTRCWGLTFTPSSRKGRDARPATGSPSSGKPGLRTRWAPNSRWRRPHALY